MKCLHVDIVIEREGSKEVFDFFNNKANDVLNVYEPCDGEEDDPNYDSISLLFSVDSAKDCTVKQAIEATERELATLKDALNVEFEVDLDLPVLFICGHNVLRVSLYLYTDLVSLPESEASSKQKPPISEREQELAAFMLKLPPLGEGELTEEEKSTLRREYVDLLVKHDALYHFDEQVENIAWDCRPPSAMEAQLLNSLTGILYGEELFEIALEKIDA